ncbi:PAS domain-containing sensor histidine kinase [Mucilaginibacter sp. BT774]|uniref:PAS domain-containing sensor histidine kinase n=1 Tax=Mucilaginibacter sp. BT774 TaxID=3062276 RepID=UPI0026752B2B|nr:PAS domain-containing sensor histidine kinase [Mucilaginibacter sp. BT774]MDO3624928.1 PAS domain-containing sensor histidine kinase [Mucilaginibacter sp. BT774]
MSSTVLNKKSTKDSQQLSARKETTKQYRQLLIMSKTGAWEYFPATGTVDCNDIYFSMLGRDINDYRMSLNEAWTNLLHPEDRADAMRKFTEYLENPTGMYECEFRMLHADGKWVWIYSRGGLLKADDNKGTVSIIGTHVDITEQKQAQEEIQRDRILLRTLIDNLPDTIYVKDAEGRKIIANRADVATIGARCEADVIGKTDLELFPNSIGLRGYKDDMEVLRTGEPLVNREEFLYNDKGEKFWLSTSKVPVYDEHGNIIRILGLGHNITERKRAEEALNKLNQELAAQSEELKILNSQLLLQQEQELEKAIAQGKFEIASEVLHDIGNALVGFGSYLTRINRVAESNNLESIRNLGTFLKTQQAAIGTAIGADKAAALVSITEGIAKAQGDNQKEVSTAIGELLNIVSHIQEILNIQRQSVRNHNGTHERKPVNLGGIIDDCRSMLFASFDKKGVKFNVNIKPGNYVIKGDHTKLMQVMLNVIKNSLEAIDMERDTKWISVAMESTGEYILLKIADNGQGFDEKTSEHFFERGFTTKKKGTGLGLYNCRSIVESHEGTFNISSDGPGLGAVTTITFALQNA